MARFLLLAAVLLCHTLHSHTSNHLQLKQSSVTNPILYKISKWTLDVRHTRYSKISRLSGGAVSDPSEGDDGISSDDDSDEEDEDDGSNDDWLKYVPEKPEDDPEFMKSFEELKQAIIDAGKACDGPYLNQTHHLPFE
jgi:hypothetical protein